MAPPARRQPCHASGKARTMSENAIQPPAVAGLSSGFFARFSGMHPIVPWLIVCVAARAAAVLPQQRLHAVRRQRDGDQHHPGGRPQHRERLRRPGHGRPYRPDGDRRLCVGGDLGQVRLPVLARAAGRDAGHGARRRDGRHPVAAAGRRLSGARDARPCRVGAHLHFRHRVSRRRGRLREHPAALYRRLVARRPPQPTTTS